MRENTDGGTIATGAREARMYRAGWPPRDSPDLVQPGVILAEEVDQALLAVQHLRDALEIATRRHAEAAAHLSRVRALIEPGDGQDARAPRPPANGVDAHARATACQSSPVAAPAGLSRREVEVLRLLAAGHSNRRIAWALCLSPRTVQRHVANLYPKIGAHCRAEATAYALRHQLA